MNAKSARACLAVSLPDGEDSTTPQFRKALEIVSNSESHDRDYKAQISLDRVACPILTGLEIPGEVLDQLTEKAAHISELRHRKRFRFGDPAMVSVAIGFLLMAALVTWHFLGRVGVFPEEALTIAAEGVQLKVEQFQVVEEPAGALEDWFMLKGFDRFRVPPNFEKYQAAGARIFKVENQPVAVLAIPENHMFFMVFDPVPFGISVVPEGSWRTSDFDHKYAAAIRQEDGMCFMVVITGKKTDLDSLLKK